MRGSFNAPVTVLIGPPCNPAAAGQETISGAARGTAICQGKFAASVGHVDAKLEALCLAGLHKDHPRVFPKDLS